MTDNIRIYIGATPYETRVYDANGTEITAQMMLSRITVDVAAGNQPTKVTLEMAFLPVEAKASGVTWLTSVGGQLTPIRSFETVDGRRVTLREDGVVEVQEIKAGRAAPAPAEAGKDAAQKISCKARNAYPDPLDCDWPFCGCDPHADKVLAAVEEAGRAGAERARKLEAQCTLPDPEGEK